ncbi:MAG: radical SAM protein [Lachnospiraceae bacterium]|nr:radical SAM protein [Lachnospiraceae bacterium]
MATASIYQNCRLCPRNCAVDRSQNKGFCKAPDRMLAARAALHYYEEPFLSGKRGSGAIFFSGCSLQCIYCQNKDISREPFFGIELSPERLKEIFFELKEKGALNINLVTGTHFTPDIARAIRLAKEEGLDLPVIWNSSGYELPETLELLDGLVDIYLPDLKTLDRKLSSRYMNAPDYPEKAKRALEEMFRQTGAFVVDRSKEACEESEDGLMKKGVCVRHLMTPGNLEDTKAVIDYLYDTFGDRIWISIMSQYTPLEAFPLEELNRKVSESEYEEAVDHAIEKGLTYCMIQEGDVADESFIPAFDGEGVRPE